MVDLLLVALLGFLGSFGHCVGMCGPITIAFSLAGQPQTARSWQHQLWFHLLLNIGRIVSYALVGAAIGGIASALIAGGQLAGIGSELRRGVALVTGSLLIWLGLLHVAPGLVPKLSLLPPALRARLHDRLSAAMLLVSSQSRWWTPALLGAAWGLMPCGFLYTAQFKAAETGSLWRGGATLLAFGLGTLPMMVGIGASVGLVSADRRSQLFRLGGWVTLAIGVMILLRTGDTMTDYTGHAALLSLMLALIARPISRLWAGPLRYRRALGVAAFGLAIAHTAHMAEHTWGWNPRAILFMLPQHQWGIAAGAIALLLMLPAALTSFDAAQKRLGRLWRSLHRLTVLALVLGTGHCVLVGSHYLGQVRLSGVNWGLTAGLCMAVVGVLAVRSRWVWTWLSLEHLYATPPAPRSHPVQPRSDELSRKW